MANGVGKILGPFSGLDCGAEGQADFRIGDFSALELGELRGDQRLKIVRCKEVSVSISRDGKARWHLDAVRTKITHHLSKGGILAADGRDVANPYFLEQANVVAGHALGGTSQRGCCRSLPNPSDEYYHACRTRARLLGWALIQRDSEIIVPLISHVVLCGMSIEV